MPSRFAENAGDRKSGIVFALRFISGKYQGGEFPIGEGQEIVIGRSSDLDMVLVEEMVSRKHARISLTNGVINIEDLGSTNGTFVNGEKVQKGTLAEGDRVLIGTNILKVIANIAEGEAADPKAVAAGRVTAKQRMSRPSEEPPRMTGNLEEIPLPDLLQLFGTSRKDGVLVLRTPQREGRIYLHEGRIRFAQIENAPSVAPLKAIYRMLEWRSGVFELDPPEKREFEQGVDVTAQEVLMEGFRQQDELNALRDRLPPFEARLVLRVPLEPKLRDLGPAELDLLEQVLSSPSLEAVFDAATGTDLETAQAVQKLIQRRYLEPG
jgi:pSer/pThr/pTyr-binding forkhead associated (FHA) protein